MAVATNDAYTWLVIYRNGTELREFDESGTVGHGFAEVDGMHVEKLALVTGTFPAFVVNVPEGAIPVFFRRRSIQMNLITETEEGRQTVHCIGWRRKENTSTDLDRSVHLIDELFRFYEQAIAEFMNKDNLEYARNMEEVKRDIARMKDHLEEVHNSMYLFVFEDGSSLLTDDLQAV